MALSNGAIASGSNPSGYVAATNSYDDFVFASCCLSVINFTPWPEEASSSPADSRNFIIWSRNFDVRLTLVAQRDKKADASDHDDGDHDDGDCTVVAHCDWNPFRQKMARTSVGECQIAPFASS